MKFEVIKGHDGIQEGTIKSLPDSYITRYMVETGYWREVKDDTTAEVKKKSRRK